MLIRHLPVCRAASYPYTKIANNNNKSAGKKKIQRETERIPRLVRSIPTGGRRRTEAWYELYQSVVRAVPNCGRSRTKVRYKAYQTLVFPVPNAGIILVFIYYWFKAVYFAAKVAIPLFFQYTQISANILQISVYIQTVLVPTFAVNNHFKSLIQKEVWKRLGDGSVRKTK